MSRRQEILDAHPYKVTYNKKRGRWYTRFKCDDGMVQRNRPTKKKLEDLIVQFYKNGECFEPRKDRYTFADGHNRWLEVQEEYGKEPNTIYKYNNQWSRFFCGTMFSRMELINITPRDIETFMISTIKEKNLKKQAGIDLYGCIKGVFYTAVMERRIQKSDNPCELVDTKRFRRFYNRDTKTQADRVLSSNEIEKLVQRLNKDVTERPTCLSPYGVRLSLLTGMRSGEICGLRWGNVMPDGILICESEKYNQMTKEYYLSDTKTSKDRTMPMTEGLKEFFDDMRKLQEKYGVTDDFVISTSLGKLHTRNLSDYMIKASKKLGFGISKNIHAIRRTFNSHMRNRGTSALMAGSIIGNTAEVNNAHYTYDICDMDTKYNIVKDVENSMLANCKFA